jgi:hypothetical protein
MYVHCDSLTLHVQLSLAQLQVPRAAVTHIHNSSVTVAALAVNCYINMYASSRKRAFKTVQLNALLLSLTHKQTAHTPITHTYQSITIAESRARSLQ